MNARCAGALDPAPGSTEKHVPGYLHMAGFEVTTYGRFWGDHRGHSWEPEVLWRTNRGSNHCLNLFFGCHPLNQEAAVCILVRDVESQDAVYQLPAQCAVIKYEACPATRRISSVHNGALD